MVGHTSIHPIERSAKDSPLRYFVFLRKLCESTESLQKTEALRQSILKKAFSGELV